MSYDLHVFSIVLFVLGILISILSVIILCVTYAERRSYPDTPLMTGVGRIFFVLGIICFSAATMCGARTNTDTPTSFTQGNCSK